MVAPTLVDERIDAGRRLIEQLDAHDFKVDSALWLFLSEPAEWRLLIASELVDTIGPRRTYEALQRTLNESQIPLALKEISLVKPEDGLVRDLRSAITTGPGMPSIRFSGNTINGTFIEGALIYRLR